MFNPCWRRGQSLSKWTRGSTAGTLAILVVTAIAGLPIYVYPQLDPVRRADAILVLGGYDYGRYRTGFALAGKEQAPVLVVSNPNGPKDAWLTQRCQEPDQGFKLICFIPDPSTTKGEGRELARLANRYEWKSVIVVTSRPHISRARLILSHCYLGSLTMVESATRIPLLRWPYEYAYQTLGYIRAALEPGC